MIEDSENLTATGEGTWRRMNDALLGLAGPND